MRLARACGSAIVTVLLALGLAGPATAVGQDAAPPKPRVTVAVIDNHVNVYHDSYYQGGPRYGEAAPDAVTPDVLAEFGIGPEHVISTTRTGDWTADYATDRAEWDGIVTGQPYWIEGTNMIVVSFKTSGLKVLPTASSGSHGTGTTSAVLNANPEAVVVFVQGNSGTLPDSWGTYPDAETWTFTHPAIDLVSTSYGPPFSPPLGYHLAKSYTGVVRDGKLHFGAADNSLALSPVDATSGPWWSVAIGGLREGEGNGREPRSGSLPDFVGDWTQTLPYCGRCETGGASTVSGTSFATPTSAGVTSKILLESRRAADHLGGIVAEDGFPPRMVVGGSLTLTNWEIRRALEAAAAYPTTGEYTPGTASGIPVLDDAPWTTTGWGLISQDPQRGVVKEALARLGVSGSPTRAKPAEACRFMTANIEARKAYWDSVARSSESRGSTGAPYLTC